MTDIIQDFDKILSTLIDLFKINGQVPEFEILENAKAKIEITGYDNWDGGTDIHTIYLEVPIDIYSKFESEIKTVENSISKKLEPILQTYPQSWIGGIIITPILTSKADKRKYSISDNDLLKSLESARTIMISVATGGSRIQDINNEYKDKCNLIDSALRERDIENPNPYSDLWEWYGKWSSGDLPTYQSRRNYINELFTPFIAQIKKGTQIHGKKVFTEPTGWTRVDRSIGEMRTRLEKAKNEEQFQAIGLLCRETLISLAQTVYDPSKHVVTDGKEPSKTDAKRMLDAYISAELAGKTNEVARKHAKAALDLANDLTHKRTAAFRLAALCAEATTALVNLIAIISGRRDMQ